MKYIKDRGEIYISLADLIDTLYRAKYKDVAKWLEKKELEAYRLIK